MVNINGTLLFQFLNFFILVLILAKFAYKPMLKVLEERRKKISADLNEAEMSRQAAQGLKAGYEKQLQQAQTEAQSIIDKAVKQAEAEGQAQLNSKLIKECRERMDAKQVSR